MATMHLHSARKRVFNTLASCLNLGHPPNPFKLADKGLLRMSLARPMFSRGFSEQVTINSDLYTIPEVDLSCETSTATIALVGAPNAGKSSLSNSIIERRVSAVSRKVNTTRARTSGVYTDSNKQLILWDTPGLVERAFVQKLGSERRVLCSEGWGAAADADVAVFVIDASRGARYWKYYANVASQLAEIRHTKERPEGTHPADCLLVLNKADTTRPRLRLLAAADFFKTNISNFEQRFCPNIFVTSAYTGQGIRQLRRALLERTRQGEFEVPPGTAHLDDDIDLIRQHLWEKLLHRVHKEVPYRCYFQTDEYRELPNGDLFISEIIRAPSKTTSLMIIGEGGRVLQWIRETAEKSISEVLQRTVRLKLVVRVSSKSNSN